MYTGKTTLNEKEFEVFQQLVYEFQITTDENTAIILEEIVRDCIDQESQVFSTMYRKCDLNNLITYLNYSQKPEDSQIKDPISGELSNTLPADLLDKVPVIDNNMYSPIAAESTFRHPTQRHRQNHKPGEILIGNKAQESLDGDLITEVELLLEDDSIFKKKTLVSCDLCSSVFSSQSKLNDHMLKHTGERPFKCPLCSKSYPVKGELSILSIKRNY